MPNLDVSYSYRPLTLNGTVYPKGLGAHAPSDIRYALSGCDRFKASIGVDDFITGTSVGIVVFEVYAGATEIYDSGVMNPTTATKQIDVSIAGASELRLVVDAQGSNDSDHANWAEARIECGGGADTTPPTITSRTPAPGATGVALSVSPTATFSEAMNPATITSSTFTLQKQGAPSPVAASVSYSATTATLDPTANLDPSSTYTLTVKGGASGVKDVAGNPLAADVTWTFATGAGGSDTTPPTIVSRTPSPGATGVTRSISPTATFSEALNPATLTTATFTVQRQGTATPVAAAVSYASTTATAIVDPSANLAASAVYIVTVKGGASGVKDVAGNPLAADVTWTFTTGTGTDTTRPTITSRTPAPGATGVALSVSPTATFSEAMNPATITSSTFTLQKQGAPSPVAASVSYSATTATLDPTANLDPSSTYTLTVKGGASGVRDVAGNTLLADVTWTFTTLAGSDTTPPTITSRTPAPGATGVALSVSPTATFSEAMNPATITSSTFTLQKQGAPSPVAASVSYSATTATLDPTANLDPSSTYTLTVKGGASGVKDVAGNPLAADVAWTFATSTGGGGGSTTYLSDLTWTSAVDHGGVPNLDVSYSYRPLTLNGTVYPKGLGAHAPSDIRYALSGCDRFKASIGVDDFITGTSVGIVVFEVYAGATEIYDSGVMNPTTATKQIDVSIAGASELRLVVDAQREATTSDHAQLGGGAHRVRRRRRHHPTDDQRPHARSRRHRRRASASLPTATFSEAMNPATIHLLHLHPGQKQGAPSSGPPRGVSYSATTAQPSIPAANLDPSFHLQRSPSRAAPPGSRTWLATRSPSTSPGPSPPAPGAGPGRCTQCLHRQPSGDLEGR